MAAGAGVRRRPVLQAAVRPGVVVLIPPRAQAPRRASEADDPVLGEALSPPRGVERFDMGVVGRLPWPTEVQGDVIPVCPVVERLRGELRPIVNGDHGRQAAPRTSRAEYACDVGTRERGLRHEGDALAGMHVDGCQDANGLSTRERVTDGDPCTKSTAHRSLGAAGAGRSTRAVALRCRFGRRRLSMSPSSRYNRYTRLRLIGHPSRRRSTWRRRYQRTRVADVRRGELAEARAARRLC